MKTSLLFCASALLLQALASPLEVRDVDPLMGRSIEIPSWEVEVTPRGEKIVLRGTVEEVHAQLLERNPNWDEDFPATDALQKRTDFSGSKVLCEDRWGYADGPRIIQGIDHLRRAGGRPVQGPGPGSCGRVSCSYNSAIYWCNDERTSKTLASFGSIADGAQYIVNRCASPFTNRIAGQVFHRTNWNVIVRRDSC